MADNGIKVNMTPSHPGVFIRTEVIEEFGLSVTRAAEILGVRRATLSDLLNRRAALSPEMALRIEKAFDVGMDLLLRMRGMTLHRCAHAQARSTFSDTSQEVPIVCACGNSAAPVRLRPGWRRSWLLRIPRRDRTVER